MNNEDLKQISEEIINNSLPKDLYGNPLIILMIIGILLNAIRVLQECNRNKTGDKIETYYNHIKHLCAKKSWFTKMRLKKIIRKEMNPDDYKLYNNMLVESILNKGETISHKEVNILLEASHV